MKEINYLQILKKGWKITWDNKFLWWFGFLVALGGGVNFNLNNGQFNETMKPNQAAAESFFIQNWHWFVLAGILLFFLFLLFVYLSARGKAGLIKSLEHIQKNEAASFKIGWQDGKKYFWKIILVNLILAVFILGLLFVLALPVIFLFFLKSIILGILAAFLALLIFIPLVILFAFVKDYSIFYLVLSNLNIRSAIECAYELFRKNIWESVIFAIFFIPIRIVVGVGIFIIAGILAVPAIVSAFLGLIILAVIFGISAGLIFLACLFLVRSVAETFYLSSWYLFFCEIAQCRSEEIIKETETEMAKNILPEPKEI